jgi:DNA polymerase (family 10)
MTVPDLSNYEFEIFKKFSSHEAMPMAEQWLNRFISLPEITHGEVTGELRRGKYSIEHIDLLLCTENMLEAHESIRDAVYPTFIQEEERSHISLLLHSGIKLVVWLAEPQDYVGRLLQTTGSDNHLTQLSQAALKKGYQFFENGEGVSPFLQKMEKEEDIYRKLEIPWIPPELRESGEEVDHPEDFHLDDLVNPADIQSDLHVHSTWSDGKNSIAEMAEAGIQRGLSFLSICDHSPFLLSKYTDASYFAKQAEEIDQVNKDLNGCFTILKGVEVDIMPDGTLDLPVELLDKMDLVVASMHVQLDQPQEIATARLIRAIENPYVNIIGHPGGRIYPMLDVIDLDWERVYRAAAFNQVALEINSHKSHPIFDDKKAHAAADLGVHIALNSDSHNTGMMSNSRFGIALARRADLKSDQVINTWSIRHLKLWLHQKRG